MLRGLTGTAFDGRPGQASGKTHFATLNCSDLPSPDHCRSLEVEESDVRKAIMSFPAGSAGGPDGLCPQHLRELISCRESGQDIVTDLAAFVIMVLAGQCSKSVAPVFYGGRMLALFSATIPPP